MDGTFDSDFSMNDPHWSYGQGGDYHLYPDGRVLLTGSNGVNDPVRGYVGLYSLIWFTNTGQYDATRAPRATNGAIYRIAPLPNGQFYCGGAFTTYEGVPAHALVRVHADGTLDTAFNAHIAWGQPWAMLPMADDGVMVGGDFLFEDGNDTLRLMRFLPDGSLDPNFNNWHTFNRTNSSSPTQYSLISEIVQLAPNLFAVCGYFNIVDGEVHGGIAMFDSTGTLLENYFQGNGAGVWTYMGGTGAVIHGIMPTGDGSDDYWIWGSYHGYDDGTTNDTLQRMVSRLHGLSVGVAEHVAPLPGGSLLLRP
ncbi:MAG: delta-60 repeat domain-containing protein, partial [Bacteroidetes bacterium]|nr:delta-60 repeat domain-containing protein [Bacteroidota bacterium]